MLLQILPGSKHFDSCDEITLFSFLPTISNTKNSYTKTEPKERDFICFIELYPFFLHRTFSENVEQVQY